MTVHDATASGLTSEIFPDTEMGRLCRAKDWAATPLGPMADWPVCLRIHLRVKRHGSTFTRSLPLFQ